MMKKIIMLTASVIVFFNAHAQELRYKMVDGKYGFVNWSGDVIIPFKYEGAFEFTEGLAAVKLNGKWGYIDKEEAVVIPFKYEDANKFGEGWAPVKLNGKWGFIDKEETVMIPFTYHDALQFAEGLAPVAMNEKWGYIDHSNKLIIPFQYRRAVPFRNGRAPIATETDYYSIDRPAVSQPEIVPTVPTSRETTILGNMKIKREPDRSGMILSIGTQPINIKFNSYKYQAGPLYIFDIAGKKVMYFQVDNKAIKCNYTPPGDQIELAVLMPAKPWPGESFTVPELLVNTNGKLNIINAFNGKKINVPVQYATSAIRFQNEVYSMYDFKARDDIDFWGNDTTLCGSCKNGYNTVTKKETVPGKSTYTKKAVTTYVKESERRWNPATRSDEWYEKTRPVTTYETIEKKEPDKIVDKTSKVMCEDCNGKGITVAKIKLHWDGKTLTNAAE